MEQNLTYLDAEEYQGNSFQKDISFKDLVMMQLKRILQNSNNEWRGGYWETKEIPVKNGMMSLVQKTYVPDTREIYSNSIEALFDLIFAHGDTKLIEAGTKADSDIDEAFKKYTKEPDKTDQNPKEAIQHERKFSDITLRTTFRSRRRRILQTLFREICCFLKRVDYFEGKTYQDEVK